MLNIISLGAGVQSSTMALMAAHGEITPMPDCAIFADTQNEPREVYKWLSWLKTKLPFPILTVTAGNLRDDELRIVRSRKSNRLYLKNSIPAFVKKDDGSKGLLGRKCTSDYKIRPIQKKVRELTGIKRQGYGIIGARMWIGISVDEAYRMKPSLVDYIENTWPLLDLNMSRIGCMSWMMKKGYPVPPRSACSFCPFHSDFEWQELKENSPEEFASVIQFEKNLQAAASKQEVLRGVPYLHSSLKPLGEIDFEEQIQGDHTQLSLFGNECEGMCGV